MVLSQFTQYVAQYPLRDVNVVPCLTQPFLKIRDLVLLGSLGVHTLVYGVQNIVWNGSIHTLNHKVLKVLHDVLRLLRWWLPCRKEVRWGTWLWGT